MNKSFRNVVDLSFELLLFWNYWKMKPIFSFYNLTAYLVGLWGLWMTGTCLPPGVVSWGPPVGQGWRLPQCVRHGPVPFLPVRPCRLPTAAPAKDDFWKGKKNNNNPNHCPSSLLLIDITCSILIVSYTNRNETKIFLWLCASIILYIKRVRLNDIIMGTKQYV